MWRFGDNLTRVLLLFPTAFEALRVLGENTAPPGYGVASAVAFSGARLLCSLCGFGLASAGVGATLAIKAYLDSEGAALDRTVTLCGLAGSLNHLAAPLGQAVLASSIRCHGIGVGEGDRHHIASEMGWYQIDDGDSGKIGDRLNLDEPPSPLGLLPRGEFLSVVSAAASFEESDARSARYPDSILEEMEGFAVALACARLDMRLVVIRGVSDWAGERDKSKWRFEEAFHSIKNAVKLLIESR